MRTISHLLMVAAVSAVKKTRHGGGNRIGRQIVGGLAFMARNGIMAKVNNGEQYVPNVVSDAWKTCAANGNCDYSHLYGPTPSPKEEALHEEIVKAQDMIEQLGRSVEALEEKVSGLTQVGLPLGAFVALLTADQRNEIIAALEARNPVAALDDLVKDMDSPNPLARLVPGFEDMVKAMKDLDASADQVQKDYLPVQQEIPKVRDAIKDYIENDKTDGALGPLIEKLKASEAKVNSDAMEEEKALKGTMQSLLICVKNSIKKKKFDGKDWDAFMADLKTAVMTAFTYKTDLIALSQNAQAIEEKINSIIRPDHMEVDV